VVSVPVLSGPPSGQHRHRYVWGIFLAGPRLWPPGGCVWSLPAA